MDWKYILKRVIVGVLVFLAIYFLKAYILLDVHAQEMSSTNVGAQSVTVTPGTAFADFTITGNPWANWRLGHLYFNFGITKTAGSSTDPIIVPRFVQVKSDTAVYICNFGTASYSNSTYTGASYSVDCPMDMGWPGLTGISIGFMPFTASANTTYNVSIGGWMTFEQNSNTQVNVDTSGTTSAINNQITNDNTNTTNIINNQNQNTQQQIESQKVCTKYDANSIVLDNNYLSTSGTPNTNNSWGVTDYISISDNSHIYLLGSSSGNIPSTCFYNVNKSLISCVSNGSLSYNAHLTIPSNSSYVRFSINKQNNQPQFQVCRNGNQAIADGQQQINDTLNNSDVTGAISSGNNLFNNFADFDNPLINILLFPIHLLQSSTQECQPVLLNYKHDNSYLADIDQYITLQCGTDVFWNKTYVSSFKVWWNMFFGGIAIYFLSLKLFHIISDAFDPFKDDMSKIGAGF